MVEGDAEWFVETLQKAEAQAADARRTLSVDDVARRLHKAFKGATKGYYARQIRGWAQRGLVDHILLAGTGRTAGRMFDADAPYRAALLSYLTALGMKPDQMRPFVGMLDNNAFQPKPLDRVRANDATFMVVELDDAGEYFCGGIQAAPAPFGFARAPAALVVDLRELFSPLVSLEREERRFADSSAPRST